MTHPLYAELLQLETVHCFIYFNVNIMNLPAVFVLTIFNLYLLGECHCFVFIKSARSYAPRSRYFNGASAAEYLKFKVNIVLLFSIFYEKTLKLRFDIV